MANECEYEMIY